jgi:hypothetical protein
MWLKHKWRDTVQHMLPASFLLLPEQVLLLQPLGTDVRPQTKVDSVPVPFLFHHHEGCRPVVGGAHVIRHQVHLQLLGQVVVVTGARRVVLRFHQSLRELFRPGVEILGARLVQGQVQLAGRVTFMIGRLRWRLHVLFALLDLNFALGISKLFEHGCLKIAKEMVELVYNNEENKLTFNRVGQQ